MSVTYQVKARRWAGGWELHIEDVGVTQATTLARAEQEVRDYLATMLDVDEVDGEVVITPELGGLEVEVAAAREAVTDTAAALGVSRGRVSQLVSG